MYKVIHWQPSVAPRKALGEGTGKSQSSGSTKYVNFAVLHLTLPLRQ